MHDPGVGMSAVDIEALIQRRLDEILPQRIEEALKAQKASHPHAMTIIASKGTLDWAYPPFILATTAAALGWDVSIFFTFYGLTLLKKDVSSLKVSPLGNPAMPMKMPFGPNWFKDVDWNIPNLLQAGIPGFEILATLLMQQTIRNKGVASIEELRTLAQEANIKFIACQMTVDLFGFSHEDFITGVDFAGAASFLQEARKADINLFV